MIADEKESRIGDVASAVSTIITAVPIYSDLIHPVAEEIGLALKTGGSLVNLCLRPIRAITLLGNGFADRADAWLKSCVSARDPEARLVDPAPYIAGPAMLGLMFSHEQNELRRLYVNLLASSIMEETHARVHPAFVSILKELTPWEARLLPHLQETPAIFLDLLSLSEDGPGPRQTRPVARMGPHFMLGSDVDNLARLRIIEVRRDIQFVSEIYEPLNEEYKLRIKEMAKQGSVAKVTYGAIELTSFGAEFVSICAPKDEWSF